MSRPESQKFPDRLKRLQPNNWLHLTLTVSRPPADCYGLFGSDMFILNPPYTLVDSMREALPYLVEALGQEDGASFSIEHRSS